LGDRNSKLSVDRRGDDGEDMMAARFGGAQVAEAWGGRRAMGGGRWAVAAGEGTTTWRCTRMKGRETVSYKQRCMATYWACARDPSRPACETMRALLHARGDASAASLAAIPSPLHLSVL
jgi:hypothetical protein